MKSDFWNNDAFIVSLVDGKMKTLLENIQSMRHENIQSKLDGISSVAGELSVELDFKGTTPTVMVSEDVVECDTRYSMLKHMDFSWRWKMSDSQKDLTNYINLVDVCNSSDV